MFDPENFRLAYSGKIIQSVATAFSPGRIGLLMAKFRQGDSAAAGELVELCYPELRRLAAARMKLENTEHTWQPTVLVNELYLELVKIRHLEGGTGGDEQEKAEFLRFTGHLMKRLLLHHARPLYRRVKRVELQDEPASAEAGARSLAEVQKRGRDASL